MTNRPLFLICEADRTYDWPDHQERKRKKGGERQLTANKRGRKGLPERSSVIDRLSVPGGASALLTITEPEPAVSL
jgi:hypothetical protein